MSDGLSFSSSPVTEFTSGLWPFRVHLETEVTDESMHSGRSTTTARFQRLLHQRRLVSLGFTAVTPALMSRIWAPAATWARAS
jgi:hypothetical protein